MFWMQFRRMPAWLGEAFDASRPEAQVYPFIFWFAFAFWNAVTAIMVLDVLGLIAYDAKAAAYVSLELFATVYFGAITVGAREALEGEASWLASFAALHVGNVEPLPGRARPAIGGHGGGFRADGPLPTSPAGGPAKLGASGGGLK